MELFTIEVGTLLITYIQYILNKLGPRTEPCGTQLMAPDQSDSQLFSTTFYFLP